jgi:predicted lysophospholipase L1 biosynthesis ABC-type transport system permease subunit
MMTHLRFYIQHALRDMTRNGRRTAFALFCVAAGVAAIVSLRSLSLMIADSLAVNIAGVNHGDIRIQSASADDTPSGGGPSDGRNSLSAEQLTLIQSWAKDNNLAITPVISNANITVAPLDTKQNVGRPQFISSYVIDPAVYPFYGPVLALDPPGVPLSKLFTGGNDVVVSKNLADNNKIKVGDQVRVGRTTETFTVRGIVSTDVEGSLRNPLAAFFGFAYFDQKQEKVLQLEPLPNAVYVQAPRGSNVQSLVASLTDKVPGLVTTTTLDVRNENKSIADLIDRLIIVMGLAALLIGSTGIIHTMLVVVSRRTLEIAVLKTLGVQGGQITWMFLIESIIMGFLGSLIGAVLGILFSLGVRSFTQAVWPQALEWRIYPEALGTGIFLGVIVTAVFGFLPTLTAGAVRPAIVLRPNETRLPAIGCLQTFLGLLFVVIVVGLVAGSLIGNLILGLVGIALAGVFMLVAIGLLWLLITLVSKLPSLGSVDLRLALRGIGAHRTRTASTLLALTVGIFSLSVITLMADSIPRLLNLQFTNLLGGNVMAFGLVPAIQRPFIIAQLKGKPGVEHFSEISSYQGELVAINGDKNFLAKVVGADNTIPIPGKNGAKMTMGDITRQSLGAMTTVDVTSPGFAGEAVDQGRTFTSEDSGKPNVILHASKAAIQVGLKVGDQVTLQFGDRDVTYTIIGISNQNTASFSMTGSFGAFTAPVDSIPAGLTATFPVFIAKVDEAHLNQVLVNLSSIPGVFPLDIGFFETLIKRVLSTFTAIPTIVAVLSLFAGAVIIANTVSLATLERRREVGVMKSIGMQGRRVLAQMVLENGLIGLLGGLIGVGIGTIATLLLSIGSETPLQNVSWGIVGALVLLSVAISLVATLFSAWSAATEKPLHVLRYE